MKVQVELTCFFPFLLLFCKLFIQFSPVTMKYTTLLYFRISELLLTFQNSQISSLKDFASSYKRRVIWLGILAPLGILIRLGGLFILSFHFPLPCLNKSGGK